MTRYYEFGAFRLDAKGRILLWHGAPVSLPPKGVDTLLVENAGAVIDKSEILRRVWKNACVEEGSLTRTISLLRKALGETAQQYIATISKRGYRFVANVSRAPEEPSVSSSDPLTLVVRPFENLSGDAGMGGWKRLTKPASKHDWLTDDEERAKNDFVSLRQPYRQVNIEVGGPVTGKSRGKVRQRASAAVNSEHAALEQNNSRQNRRPAESA